jgi:hypothetical protein
MLTFYLKCSPVVFAGLALAENLDYRDKGGSRCGFLCWVAMVSVSGRPHLHLPDKGHDVVVVANLSGATSVTSLRWAR